MFKIQIILSRDSVCMADDVEDHTKMIDVVLKRNMQKTVKAVAKRYLPYVTGYGHTWDCYLDGTKIAVISGNCKKIISTTNCFSFTNGCKIDFKYHSAD